MAGGRDGGEGVVKFRKMLRPGFRVMAAHSRRETMLNGTEMTEGTRTLQAEALLARLQRQLREAKRRVQELEEAVDLLEKNPDTERLMTLLGRVVPF